MTNLFPPLFHLSLPLSSFHGLCCSLLLFCLCLSLSLSTASILDASVPPIFSTNREIDQLHILTDFHVMDTHSQRLLPHFHSSHHHQFRTKQHTYTHVPSASATTTEQGEYQPFPDTVALHFSAFNRVFNLSLVLIDKMFTEDAVIEVRGAGDKVIDTAEPIASAYWSPPSQSLVDDWGIVVLREDGRFHAVVQRDGEVYQAEPVEHFSHDMDTHAFHEMSRQSSRGMMIYRHRDLINQHDKQCGTEAHREPQRETDTETRQQPQQPAAALSFNNVSDGSRRLLQITSGDYVPIVSVENTVTVMDIFTTVQRLPVTIVSDAGFTAIYSGVVADLQAAVAALFASTNIIYIRQIQLFIQIKSIIIMTTADTNGTNPWNKAPSSAGSSCSDYNINSQLEDFTSYATTSLRDQGAVQHLLTNCWPSGTVGLSWIGYFCWYEYANSVSSYNAPFWLTFAHEVAHTLGAQHTLSAGGIMSYFDEGRYPIGTGPYQFAPANEDDFDSYLQQADTLEDGNTSPYCIANYAAICGNGILEPGEQCDDQSSCCTSNCTFVAHAQCTGTSCCSAACQYSPSTTVCAGGNGYCANGQCLLSSCPGGWAFCGMDTTTYGGCRQSCLLDGLFCYSGLGLEAPDGTVCNTGGGACSSGMCVANATVVTYNWLSSPWSSCSCSGYQTSTLTCIGSDLNTYPNSYCSSVTSPATNQSCAIPTSCYSYAWAYSAWTSCNASCDGGIQTRSATCQLQSTPPVNAAATDCASITLQSLSQSCDSSPCLYMYVLSPFGSCSVDCGGGIQNRTSPTLCQRFINSAWQTVPLSWCASVLGYTVNDTQVCNTGVCDTYAWSYGSYGNCNVTAGCGGDGYGVQTRTAICMDVTTNTQVNTSHCSATPANTSQPCGNAACPSYSWVYSAWSACSTNCGGGVSNRTAACFDSVHIVWAAYSDCLSALGSPNSTMSCNTAACPVTSYVWEVSAWTACPVLCGGSAQIREVTCVDQTANLVVNNSFCNMTSEPASSQSCGQRTCNLFSWSVTAWSACSVTCGGGTMWRNVYCQNYWTHALTAWQTCVEYMVTPLPATTVICNATPCGNSLPALPGGTDDGGNSIAMLDNSGWSVGPWSQCAVTCGGGFQTRAVFCVNASLCSFSLPPVSEQLCNTHRCPTYWSVSDWSACSSTCGGGYMTRNVSCLFVSTEDDNAVNGSSVAVIVPDDQCSSTRPSENGNCNFFPCPRWSYSGWSQCSAACGAGISTRTTTCTRYDGTSLPSSDCVSSPLDVLSVPCEVLPCPHWYPGVWSDCSSPCGGGTQTRELTCRMPHDDVYYGAAVSPQLCQPQLTSGESEENGVPITVQACNTQTCPRYYWLSVPVSPCSSPCGGGTQLFNVVCMSAESASSVDELFCLSSARPSSSVVCNAAACPAVEWVAAPVWNDCDVVCGDGTQTRFISCMSTADPSDRVDDTLCSIWPMPPNSQGCALPPSVCYGGDFSAGQQVNGICIESIGRCECRSGFSGPTCSIQPSISRVSTGAEAFARGVPLDETLTIEWDSTGSLPFVSLILMHQRMNGSHSMLGPGDYIAQQILNYDGYDWSVASVSGLTGGDGYFIRVWFSHEVFGDSDLFTIADPCGYVSCGERGTCSAGVCSCLPGFTGDECSTGPCDRAQCNEEFSVECNDLDFLVFDGNGALVDSLPPSCECLDGWSGSHCNTPPACNTTTICLNGADTDLSTVFVQVIDIVGPQRACGKCKCTNSWSGASCDICPIQCMNGGLPDANCTHCVCPANSGYFGPACQSRYYDLQLTLSLPVWHPNLFTSYNQSLLRITEFETLIATDLSIAAGQAALSNKLSIGVTNITLGSRLGDLSVGLRFGRSSPMSSAYDFARMLDSSAALLGQAVVPTSTSQSLMTFISTALIAGVHPPTDLATAYQAFANMFGDTDSQVYRGVLTTYINQSIIITVRDVSGIDHPSNPPQAHNLFIAAPSSSTIEPDDNTDTSSSEQISWLLLSVLLPVLCTLCFVVCASVFVYRRYCRSFDQGNTARVGATVSKSPLSLSVSHLEMMNTVNTATDKEVQQQQQRQQQQVAAITEDQTVDLNTQDHHLERGASQTIEQQAASSGTASTNNKSSSSVIVPSVSGEYADHQHTEMMMNGEADITGSPSPSPSPSVSISSRYSTPEMIADSQLDCTMHGWTGMHRSGSHNHLPPAPQLSPQSSAPVHHSHQR